MPINIIEQKLSIGDKPIPYFLNALFSSIGHLTDDIQLDRGKYEFHQPKNLEVFFITYGMKKNSNIFNTAENRKKTYEIVKTHLESGEKLQIVTMVCPPYKKKRLGARENIGLMTNFEDDPIDNGFLYSYKLLANTLVQTGEFFKSLGLDVELVFVVGDWGLRDNSERINSYSSNPGSSIDQLTMFCQSAEKYLSSHYPETQILVDRFSNSTITEQIPFVMPQTPESKRRFLKDHFCKLLEEEEKLDPKLHHCVLELQKIVDFYEKDKLNFIQLSKPDNWCEFTPPVLDLPTDELAHKRIWIRFLQIFRDTTMSRSQEKEAGLSETNMDIADSGFWDAMIKMYEYIVYATTFKEKYPKSLMAYFDSKYPSAGLAFEEGGYDLLYLDTNKYWIPMDKLGIRMNPF
ncbi:MAG: hypothetical protein ACOZAN_00035 [Patescibacteria group bacterium]